MTNKRNILLIIMALFLASGLPSFAQTFQQVTISIPGFGNGGTDWGDFDGDGDLDLAICGQMPDGSSSTRLYRNKNGSFIEVTTAFPSLYAGSLAWGDYDNDNDLDLLMCGTNSSGEGDTRIFRNDNGSFVDSNIPLTPIAVGEALWLDYNNDGWADILVTGDTLYNNPMTALYKNNGDGSFTQQPTPLFHAVYACASVADYDNDGDQDIFLAGVRDSEQVSILYRNDEGLFVESGLLFDDVAYGDAIFFDFDNDRDHDLAYMGSIGGGYYDFYLYRNNGNGTFTKLSDNIEGEWVGTIDASDINHDGLTDLAVTGSLCCGDMLTEIYQNTGNGTFTLYHTSLVDLSFSQINFGDYDNDGDADIFLNGIPKSGPMSASYLYSNMLMSGPSPSNTPPSVPDGLTANVNDQDVVLEWNPSTDNKTPAVALTYALRIGTAPQGMEVMAPLANPADGFTRTYAPGNVGLNTEWQLNDLPTGIYYWSVQSLDHCNAASPFAPEQQFVLGNVGIREGGDDQMTISPNPSERFITVNGVLPDGCGDYRICNLMGAVILTGAIAPGQSIIDLGSAAPGIYLLTFTRNPTTVIKVVKR